MPSAGTAREPHSCAPVSLRRHPGVSGYDVALYIRSCISDQVWPGPMLVADAPGSSRLSPSPADRVAAWAPWPAGEDGGDLKGLLSTPRLTNMSMEVFVGRFFWSCCERRTDLS